MLADRLQTGTIPTHAKDHLLGKEGVDGSSPSEGSAKAPEIGAFALSSNCGASFVRWVWSRLWSFRAPEGPRPTFIRPFRELEWNEPFARVGGSL
jgi:hypothetical protein